MELPEFRRLNIGEAKIEQINQLLKISKTIKILYKQKITATG